MKPVALFGLLGLGTLVLASRRRAPAAPPVVIVTPGQPGHVAQPQGDAATGPTRSALFKLAWEALLGDMMSLELYYQRKGQNTDANTLSKVYVAVDAALPAALKVTAVGTANIDKQEADRIFDSLKSRFEELATAADQLNAKAAGDELRKGATLFESEVPRSLPDGP